MIREIRKWGNSLALRIPKETAADVGLTEKSLVVVTRLNKTILISPVKQKKQTLDQILTKITPGNRHGEIETGKPVGNEAW
jgi:antitoxin MazE